MLLSTTPNQAYHAQNYEQSHKHFQNVIASVQRCLKVYLLCSMLHHPSSTIQPFIDCKINYNLFTSTSSTRACVDTGMCMTNKYN